ncbi:MAG: ABC transporter substrate binding protein [Pseudolabrys sp.]
MFQLRENVGAGALMSYRASLPDLFRRGASYVHRILQGTRPADLPVEQAVKFELVINLFQQFINSIVDAMGYGQILGRARRPRYGEPPTLVAQPEVPQRQSDLREWTGC